MRRACAGLVGLLIGAGPAVATAATPPGTPIRDLTERAADLIDHLDPAADDWTSEWVNAQAHQRLGELAARLAEALPQASSPGDLGLDEFFLPEIRLPALRPGGGRQMELNGMHIRRIGPDGFDAASLMSPAQVFWKLLEPHGRAGDLRIAFKEVQVELIDVLRFKTTVLFQAYSGSGGGAKAGGVQQNAVWQVTWVRSGPADAPLIADLAPQSLDEVWADRGRFVDLTRAVIRNDSDWHPHLSRGSDYWYGRLDALGEMNFMGHEGIAVGDVNGDGLDDLYVGLGNGLPNKLFVQQPDGTVRDTARAAGVDWLDATKGVLLIDVDNDGDQDLLCALGPTVVYCRNDGTGRFTPFRALRSATPAPFYSLTAADYDLDGDLDVYACRYVKQRYGVSVPLPMHDAKNGPANHLLRNDGADGFTDVTREVGLAANNARFSLAASWFDYDADGDSDLYVANDFGPNGLYRNDGGRFVEVAAQAGAEDQAAGMGVTCADFDLDGDVDLYVSNMFSSAGQRIAYQPRFMSDRAPSDLLGVRRHALGNTLLANRGDGTFEDVSDRAGVRMGRWAWGAMFVDLDNDAYDDLVVPNGFLTNRVKDDL